MCFFLPRLFINPKGKYYNTSMQVCWLFSGDFEGRKSFEERKILIYNFNVWHKMYDFKISKRFSFNICHQQFLITILVGNPNEFDFY